ncbi:MAG: dihydroorotate dehydrogenase [Desulfurococcaceae archaeon]
MSRPRNPGLAVTIAGLRLKNPVMNASGTYDPFLYRDIVDPQRLGAVVLKSITRDPREGNEPPRMHEVPCGVLNSIGIPNEGIEGFLRHKAPLLASLGDVVVIASVAGFSAAEFAEVVERLEAVKEIGAYEINVSCPNLERGGINCALSEHCVAEVTGAVREKTRKPVIVKLAPDVTDVGKVARVAVDAGADALTVANTYRAMVVDLRSRRPIFRNVVAGYSGPAVKPLTLRAVYEVVRAVEVPVIASGGITTARDALEYLLVGARAIQVGTANFVDPGAMIKVIEGIREFLASEGIADVNDFIGSLKID